MADVNLSLADTFALKGNPLATGANLDELRKADVAGEKALSGYGVVDPLIHLVGRTRLGIGQPAPTTEEWIRRLRTRELDNLQRFINREAKTVKSSSGEILLDYGKGVLTVDGEKAQVAAGNLKEAGPVELKFLRIESGMDLLAVALVPLDNRTLESSERMLLQLMSEEKASHFQAEDLGGDRFRILNIGMDPWLFREVQAKIQLKRADAAALKVTALDLNGYPAGEAGNGLEIRLKPGCVYYLIER